MSPEEKQLLEETLKLSKENNTLLLRIRKTQRWGQIMRALYWLVIIGVAFGAFYYIQPFIGNLFNIYTGGVSGINNISDITDSLKNNKSDVQNVQDLLKELNN